MLRSIRPLITLRPGPTAPLSRMITAALPPKPPAPDESKEPTKDMTWPISPTQTMKVSESAPGVDSYLMSAVSHPRYALDSTLLAAQARSHSAGLPPIAVSPLFGQYLSITAKAMKAERILEIGTLGGYSTAFLANALPSHGLIDTIEISHEHAKIAQRNFLGIDLFPFPTTHVGPALEVLERPEFRDAEYDLIFIDADKVNTLPYLIESLARLRSGGLVILDNTVRAGRVAEIDDGDANVEGVKRMYDWIKEDGGRTVLATTLQTVGEKGWDGFTLVYKLEEAE